jgi:Ser/Thr protein kinase RdoA (MazF antagonist)
VTTEALSGVPLAELLPGPRAHEALGAVGAAVARLHRCVPFPGSSLHGPADEVTVTLQWERAAQGYGLAGPPAGVEVPPNPATLRLVHRDLHDGQLLLATDRDGRFAADGVGLLDFDQMAAGDPALDLANLVEHLVLRARQGVLADADSAVQALLSGYGPDEDVLSRVACYRTLTARRLGALYSFRATNLVT